MALDPLGSLHPRTLRNLKVMYLPNDSSLIVTGMHHLYKVNALNGKSIWRSESLGSYTTLRPYPPTFMLHEKHVRSKSHTNGPSEHVLQRSTSWKGKPSLQLVKTRDATALSGALRTGAAFMAPNLIANPLCLALVFGLPPLRLPCTLPAPLKLYAGYCGKVSRVDSATGQLRWRFKMNGTWPCVAPPFPRFVLTIQIHRFGYLFVLASQPSSDLCLSLYFLISRFFRNRIYPRFHRPCNATFRGSIDGYRMSILGMLLIGLTQLVLSRRRC